MKTKIVLPLSFLFILSAFILILYSCSKQINSSDSTSIKIPPAKSKALTVIPITLVNPGFEANGATQNPTGWTTTANAGNADASYTQTGGHSGSYCLSHWKKTAYQVTTSQTVTGLATGYYSLSVWVENGGGQNSCYLMASNYGGITRMTSLPVSSTWVQVIIRGIYVTNGTLTIGVSSNANKGNWCKMDDFALNNDGIQYNFLKGGDMSELSYIESKGGKFYTNGVQTDCYKILADSGFNIARLRLYNDPGNASYYPSNLLPTGFQNPTDILAQALRAKNAGMQIELTFHYSDYWTNGSTQYKPHAWVGLTGTALDSAVYNFTYNFMMQMKNQGTTPQYVSLGNEIVGGILFPDGSDSSSFSTLATLLNEGYNAVKAVSPSTQVIIHLDDAGNQSKYDWFFGALIAAGGKFDVIGASYYPYWTNKTVSTIVSWANYTTAEFNKPIMIMETGYNWNPTLQSGANGQLVNDGPYTNTYGSTQAGQEDFLYECFNGLKSANNGQVLGDLYWDPVMIATPGVGWELGQPNVVDNSTVFDFTGHALPSLKAFEYNN